MKIKRIITSGCSFSDKYTSWTWPHQLEAYVNSIDDTVTFDHRGMGHQGQELIQKKTSNAIIDALEQGYRPDEIAVLVMWSSNDRKTWYITNREYVKTIRDYWEHSGGNSWATQFCDLKNSLENTEKLEFDNKNGKYHVCYNPNGGWYHSSWHHNEPSFLRDYLMFTDFLPAGEHSINVSAVHLALENMILLQNLCKLHGILFYQQYFMEYVCRDLEVFKDHEIISYLYKQLDKETCIYPSINEYVVPKGLTQHPNDPHPNPEGHKVYFNDILLPRLLKSNFFD